MTSSSKKPLEPEDFPVDAEGRKIKKQDGTPIADAESAAVAAEIAERLNETKPGAKKTSGQPDLQPKQNPLESLLTTEPALLRIRP